MNHELLKEILDYNPDTGIFTWKKLHNTTRVGKIAGSSSTKFRYIFIKIKDKPYSAHRLAWLYVYGQWPVTYIDHINGNTGDNRICNLREVSFRENTLNRKEHRNGHLQGTSFHKVTGKWRAQIRINGVKNHLGLFNSEGEAHNAYLKAMEELSE